MTLLQIKREAAVKVVPKDSTRGMHDQTINDSKYMLNVGYLQTLMNKFHGRLAIQINLCYNL